MPISVSLDEESLAALRARSEAEGRPVEAVLTDAVRRGLAGWDAPTPAPASAYTLGLLPERPGEPRPTNELVWQLLDEDE